MILLGFEMYRIPVSRYGISKHVWKEGRKARKRESIRKSMFYVISY